MCDPIAFPGWYYVKPVHPELAPILHRAGWYVHHSDLHLVEVFAVTHPRRTGVPLSWIAEE
jgi:hypothetical protein